MEPSGMKRVRSSAFRVSIAFILLATLTSCKVVSVNEDRALRARRSGDLNVQAFVDRLWAVQIVPQMQRRAIPARELLPAIDADIDRAGARFGRKAGEGAAWTFVVTASGRVLSVDRSSRRGVAAIALDGVSPPRAAVLQIGPVVSSAAIRDASPFLTFNDFSDQLVFADVARALTDRATGAVAPAARNLRPGQHISFAGVYGLRRADDPIVITPYLLSSSSGGGA